MEPRTARSASGDCGIGRSRATSSCAAVILDETRGLWAKQCAKSSEECPQRFPQHVEYEKRHDAPARSNSAEMSQVLHLHVVESVSAVTLLPTASSDSLRRLFEMKRLLMASMAALALPLVA